MIVAVVAIWLLDTVIGTVHVLAGSCAWVVIIGLLVFAYFKLRDDDE